MGCTSRPIINSNQQLSPVARQLEARQVHPKRIQPENQGAGQYAEQQVKQEVRQTSALQPVPQQTAGQTAHRNGKQVAQRKLEVEGFPGRRKARAAGRCRWGGCLGIRAEGALATRKSPPARAMTTPTPVARITAPGT